jgi:hypothetical protein
LKEFGQQEQAGSSIEAMAILAVDQGTPATSVVVLLVDGHVEAADLGQTSCQGDASDSSSHDDDLAS